MLHKLLRCLAALVVVLFGASSVFADTLRVPQDFALIQSAIDAASDGDSVLIAPGTYEENEIYLGYKDITVTGVDPTDWAVVEATVVDGRHRADVFRSSGPSLLTGLTIRNGYSHGILDVGSMTVSLCLLLENSTGISTQGQSSSIIDCRFVRNGVYGLVMGKATTVTRCDFVDNDEWGAFITADEGVNISNSTFKGSGRHYAYDTIKMDRATNVEVMNCVLSGNGVTDADCIDILYSDDIRITNCTVAGNVGNAIRSYDSTVKVTNTILWGNSGQELIVDPGDVSVTYSDVEGGWRGEGNIDVGPYFRFYKGFDGLLNLGSPCIDAGDPSIQDGISDSHPQWPNWYPNGTRSDMGAYGGPENGGWLN